MTVAARSALAMRDALHKHTRGAKPNFQAAQTQYFAKAAALFEAPWMLATLLDPRILGQLVWHWLRRNPKDHTTAPHQWGNGSWMPW